MTCGRSTRTHSTVNRIGGLFFTSTSLPTRKILRAKKTALFYNYESKQTVIDFIIQMQTP